MERLSGTPILPLNSTVSPAKGEQKPLTISNGTFSEALARVKEKAATTIATPAPSVGVQNVKNTSPVTPGLQSLTNAPPAHFQLTGSQNEAGGHAFHERALALRAYRQQLLASNIANADTPGYKAVDIDIQEALRTGRTVESVEVKYAVPSQGSVDGNTVDMDVERVKFAANALMYQYEVDRVKGHHKKMEDLLKGTPY
ncbi:hypothetical protein KDM87_06055 [Undibacterium sp. FT147W]|uniref:Flagellar basal body rod protein N-terminal domain-containing protein n=1 Tax=Undibacterium rivi TaxID=2828729 RepID=A0ABS5H0B7_9BURK|nr:flagellar basal body protein [Undibacterium rivi]MBR7792156.1 hypothetical protein [Undibacterium rivi]